MIRCSKLTWMAGWSAPVGWLAAAVPLGLWIDSRAFIWGAACAVVALLGYVAALHHAHSSERPVPHPGHGHGRLPPWHALTFLVTLLLASPALAQPSSSTKANERQSLYSGSDLFKTYCASCHGVAGKGDGALATQLRFPPADLTLLARRNKGKWDGDKVRRAIDGRDPVKGHGGTDMPVWGDAFKSSREGYSEDAVREKIQALEEHLRSLQASP